MKYLMIVLALSLCGCYRATHLTREITIERDADGKITKTIEREVVYQEIAAEGIKPEMLKGIKMPEPSKRESKEKIPDEFLGR